MSDQKIPNKFHMFPNSHAQKKKTSKPLGYVEKDERERYRETEVGALRSGDQNIWGVYTPKTGNTSVCVVGLVGM